MDNNLFESGYHIIGQDNNGNDRKKNVVIDSVYLLYLNTPEKLVIRFLKNGDQWNDLANTCETKTSALFGASCSVMDDIQYCDYIFEKIPDNRLYLSHGVPKANGTTIQVTEKISYDVSMMCFGSSSVEHKSISAKGGGYIKIDGQGEEKYFETPFMKDFDFIAELEKIIGQQQINPLEVSEIGR